ncbi:MAG: hypothetical protein A2161_14260 [Candidatus Schekmanbacteria bacterium RBG_13_48_7]|uniref:Glycosyltransferase RgtA/B/C/D-like domain-containing protein n=1 Tax=Candidatus Schekmanbacteria bacterium RBG_13_48_7 TaxID=1817878 RepID=A0A1F7S0G1_9BACT|nr:MAG: hypothetical protein A2161_14260 [Candidatus Schekmanbacteria bacterium RBG_13_48_7]
MNPDKSGNYKTGTFFLLLSLFLALTTVISHLPDVSWSVPGSEFGSLRFLWSSWACRNLISQEFPDLHRQGFTPYPEKDSFSADRLSPLNVWISLILQFFLTPVIAYNVLVILYLTFSCWGMYYFLKSLELSNWISFGGGLLFAYSPLMNYFLSDGLQAYAVAFIPFHFYYLLRFLNSNRFKYDGFFAAVFWVLTALSTPVHSPILMFSIFCLLFTESECKSGDKQFFRLKILLQFFIPLIILGHIFAVSFSDAIKIVDKPVMSLFKSVNLVSGLRLFGIIPWILFPFGLFRKQYEKQWIFILPLSITLVYWVVYSIFIPGQGTSDFSIFQFRWTLLAQFSLCVFAATGMENLANITVKYIPKPFRYGICILVILTVFTGIMTGLPAIPYYKINNQEWCSWLKNQEGDFAVLEIPYEKNRNISMLHQVSHGKRIFWDFSNDLYSYKTLRSSILSAFAFKQSFPISARLVAMRAGAIIDRYRLKYLILNPTDDRLLKREDYNYFKKLFNGLLGNPVKSFDGITVYSAQNLCNPESCECRLIDFIDIGSEDDTLFIEGFLNPEKVEETDFRWSSGNSVIYISLGGTTGDFNLSIRIARYLRTKIYINLQLQNDLIDRFEIGEQPFEIRKYQIKHHPGSDCIIPLHVQCDSENPGIMIDWISINQVGVVQ